MNIRKIIIGIMFMAIVGSLGFKTINFCIYVADTVKQAREVKAQIDDIRNDPLEALQKKVASTEIYTSSREYVSGVLDKLNQSASAITKSAAAEPGKNGRAEQ